MPRKRNKKNKTPDKNGKINIKKEAIIPDTDLQVIIGKQKKSTLGEEQLEALKAISYETYTRFIRNDEDIIVVVYEVPAMRLVGEDQIRNWKLGMEAALINAANNRRLSIGRDKFQFKALPQGEMTLIKGFFRMADVTGGAGKEQHQRQRPPQGREGLIIEE